MQEQLNKKPDIDILPDSESTGLSEKDKARWESESVESNKENRERIPDAGGSRVKTSLSEQEMLDATESASVDERILRPDISSEAEILKKRLAAINSILSDQSEFTSNQAYKATNLATGAEAEEPKPEINN